MNSSEAAEWMERANCKEVGPDIFFTEKEDKVQQAREICSGCEVKNDCLEYAIDKKSEHGTWGGYTEDEIRVIRRKRRALGKAATA